MLNCSLQLLSQDYNLVSHITGLAFTCGLTTGRYACYHADLNLNLLSAPILCVLILYERQIFENLFMTILFSSLLRCRWRRNIFHISYSSSYLSRGLNHGLAQNKPTHYLLDYGDYKLVKIMIVDYLSPPYKPTRKSADSFPLRNYKVNIIECLHPEKKYELISKISHY